MKYLREFFKKHSLPLTILIIFLVGFGGALVGEIAARAYLLDSLYGFSPFGNLRLPGLGDQGLIITNARNVTVQQDVKVDEIVNSASRSLAGIYKKQAPEKSSLVFQPENFYKLSDSAGQAFIISSDGWLITSLAIVKNYNDFVLITADKKIYEIDRALADNLTPFTFIHTQARDLPVMKFADSSSIKSGSLVIAASWPGFSAVTNVVGYKNTGGLIESSENFSRKLLLTDKLASEYRGAVLFNLAGEVIGLLNDKAEVEAINNLNGAIRSVFKNKAIKRPSLGIYYVNLAGLAETEKKDSRWEKGAVIYNKEKGTAIKKGSPAEKAGLEEGDIILSVNDITLNKDNNFNDIIQTFEGSQTITLSIYRAGQEKEVKVVLGDVK